MSLWSSWPYCLLLLHFNLYWTMETFYTWPCLVLHMFDAVYHAVLWCITNCKPPSHCCKLYSQIGWPALAVHRHILVHFYAYIRLFLVWPYPIIPLYIYFPKDCLSQVCVVRVGKWHFSILPPLWMGRKSTAKAASVLFRYKITELEERISKLYQKCADEKFLDILTSCSPTSAVSAEDLDSIIPCTTTMATVW